MKFLVIALAVVLAVSAEDKYSSENDDLDIITVVADQKSLQAFVDCFNDKGPCEPVPADFKKDIDEAVKQACSKCTDAQKHIFNVFLAGLKQKLPGDYAAFKNKYDPENKYFSGLEAAVASA